MGCVGADASRSVPTDGMSPFRYRAGDGLGLAFIVSVRRHALGVGVGDVISDMCNPHT